MRYMREAPKERKERGTRRVRGVQIHLGHERVSTCERAGRGLRLALTGASDGGDRPTAGARCAKFSGLTSGCSVEEPVGVKRKHVKNLPLATVLALE